MGKNSTTVLTVHKLTKIESDELTIYQAEMKGQYVHTSDDGATSIVDIKVTIESQDKNAIGKVGEYRRITFSPVNATLDQFETGENQ